MFRGLFEKATTPKKKDCEGGTPKKKINDLPTTLEDQQSGIGSSQTTQRNSSPPSDQVHTSPTSTIETETSHGDESRTDATSPRDSDNASRNLQDEDSLPSSRLSLGVSQTHSRNIHPTVIQVQPTPAINATGIDTSQVMMEKLLNKMSSMENHMFRLNEDNVQLHSKFDRLQGKYDHLQSKYDHLQSKYDQLKTDTSERISSLEEKVKKQEAWIN